MFVGWAVVRRREFAEIAKRIAETLKWLIEAAYAGRKIMVWAHNAHVMNARYGPGFGSVSPEPLKDGMMPSGVWFTDSYGDSLYIKSALLPIRAAMAGSAHHQPR